MCSKKNKLWWYPQQSQRFTFTIFLNLLRTPLNLTWLCTMASWNHLRNLLRNPVESDLSLHQSLPDSSPEPSPKPRWTWPGFAPKPPRPSPEPYSGTLLNLTWLCTKAYLLWNLFRNPLTKASQTFNEPSPEPCWTWPGSAPKPPRPSPEPSPELSPEPSPELSPEPSPEPCWTSPGSAPNPPVTFSGTFSGTSSRTCWTWLGFAPRLPGTFSGTFSGTLLNLTWLCTKASRILSRNLCGTLLNLIRNLFGTSLNLTRRPHQCTPELFWAKDPISLRCWGIHRIMFDAFIKMWNLAIK